MTEKYLSLVCIIKNEEYLEEFIIYHKILGVEYFYIYDNESTVPIKNRLDHYFYHKHCRIIEWPGKVRQMDAYNHFHQHYGHETRWAMFIDGDEFMLPKNHDTLVSFLKEYEEFSGIAINWINFGSNYHQFKQPGYLIENFKYCETEPDGHVKSIVKPIDIQKINNPHYAILRENCKYDGYVDPLKRKILLNRDNHYNKQEDTISVIQVNHYWGKSYGELKQKIDRGRAMMGSKREMVPNYHDLYNLREDNLIIKKYLPQVKRIFEAICTHPKMYKILNKDLEKNFGDDLDSYTRHLIDHGIYEKRYFKIEQMIPDFNLDVYRKNYKDLYNLTCLQLIDHYVNWGAKEGRIYNRLLN